MSAVVAFEQMQVPAHLQTRKTGGNRELLENVGLGFPVLSIKGKVFALVQNQERKVLTRELDGERVPVPAVEVVLIKANSHLSKSYYKGEYEDGDSGPPDCTSRDGKVPDEGAENPQAASCALCPHNVWGSGKSGKGKACQDARRVAVSAVGQINEPMLLRVPPASLKPLAEYAARLDNRGLDYDAVITRVKMDTESPTPLLVFEPRGYLTEEQYSQVVAQKNSPLVDLIIGATAMPVRTKSEEKPKAKSKAEPEPVAKAKTKSAPEPEPEPEPEPAAKAKSKTRVAAMDDDLTDLLSSLDD